MAHEATQRTPGGKLSSRQRILVFLIFSICLHGAGLYTFLNNERNQPMPVQGMVNVIAVSLGEQMPVRPPSRTADAPTPAIPHLVNTARLPSPTPSASVSRQPPQKVEKTPHQPETGLAAARGGQRQSHDAPETMDKQGNSAAKEFSELFRHAVQDNANYPILARNRQLQGNVMLQYRMDQQGFISHVTVVASSGYGILDRAAMHAVRKTSPFLPAREYLQDARTSKITLDFIL